MRTEVTPKDILNYLKVAVHNVREAEDAIETVENSIEKIGLELSELRHHLKEDKTNIQLKENISNLEKLLDNKKETRVALKPFFSVLDSYKDSVLDVITEYDYSNEIMSDFRSIMRNDYLSEQSLIDKELLPF